MSIKQLTMKKLILLLFIPIVFGCRGEVKNEPVITLEYITEPLQNIGIDIQKRATQRMVVSTESIPSEEILKNTAYKHWDKSSYSRYNELTVFIYLPEMDTGWAAYCIVEFDKNGAINQFRINESSILGTKWE